MVRKNGLPGAAASMCGAAPAASTEWHAYPAAASVLSIGAADCIGEAPLSRLARPGAGDGDAVKWSIIRTPTFARRSRFGVRISLLP
jgi:hypothetical protein